MTKHMLAPLAAVLLLAGCGQAGLNAASPVAAGAVAAQAAKVDAKTTARAVALLAVAFPAWEYPAKNAFSSVSIPGSHAQPVSQKTAGVDGLTLKRVAKSKDRVTFSGYVKTEAQAGGTSTFAVEGTVDLATEKVTTDKVRYIP